MVENRGQSPTPGAPLMPFETEAERRLALAALDQRRQAGPKEQKCCSSLLCNCRGCGLECVRTTEQLCDECKKLAEAGLLP